MMNTTFKLGLIGAAAVMLSGCDIAWPNAESAAAPAPKATVAAPVATAPAPTAATAPAPTTTQNRFEREWGSDDSDEDGGWG